MGSEPLYHPGVNYVEGLREVGDNRNVMVDVAEYLPYDAVQGWISSVSLWTSENKSYVPWICIDSRTPEIQNIQFLLTYKLFHLLKD